MTFDYNHIQRSALLLLQGVVYVAFAPSDANEMKNGWIFGYTYNGTAFSQTVVFSSTPYGSGGGIWQSGAGLAAEVRPDNSSYIYAVTGNGTFDTAGVYPAGPDLGDSLLKINPSNFTLVDYYIPSDNFNFGTDGMGRCAHDEDFGSGGVLVFPEAFYLDQNTSTHPNLVVNADKESKLYVANRDNMGHFNSSGGNNIQTITTPPIVDQAQGYWASPAYWKYTDQSGSHYLLYYSATDENTKVAPYALNAYQLLTSGSSGPISAAQVLSTDNLFCPRSPTPSVSSNGAGAGTGIVWAIERGNSHSGQNKCDGNPLPAVLHAFDATTLASLYDSRHVTTQIGGFTTFSTPTIFQSRVYIGTQTEVDVFGLCSSQTSGCKP